MTRATASWPADAGSDVSWGVAWLGWLLAGPAVAHAATPQDPATQSAAMARTFFI